MDIYAPAIVFSIFRGSSVPMGFKGCQNLGDLCSADEQESTCGTMERAVNTRSYFCCSSSAGAKHKNQNSRGEPHVVFQAGSSAPHPQASATLSPSTTAHRLHSALSGSCPCPDSVLTACKVIDLPPGCCELARPWGSRGGGLRLAEGSGRWLLLSAFPPLGISMGFCLESSPSSLDEIFFIEV